MSVFNSINNAFVALVVIIICVGLALGLVVNQTDLVNFIRNSAEAEQHHIANQYQAAQNQIDLQYYQLERQFQSQEAIRQMQAASAAKIAQAQEEVRVQRENDTLAIQRDTQLIDITLKLLVVLGFGLSAAMSVGATFFLYRLAQLIPTTTLVANPGVAATPATASVADLEPWNDPAHRAWRITQARTRELKDLQEKLARQAQSTPSRVHAIGRR